MHAPRGRLYIFKRTRRAVASRGTRREKRENAAAHGRRSPNERTRARPLSARRRRSTHAPSRLRGVGELSEFCQCREVTFGYGASRRRPRIPMQRRCYRNRRDVGRVRETSRETREAQWPSAQYTLYLEINKIDRLGNRPRRTKANDDDNNNASRDVNKFESSRLFSREFYLRRANPTPLCN